MDSKIIFLGSWGAWFERFCSGVVSGRGSAFCVGIFGPCGTMALPKILERFRELFERGAADRGAVQGLQLGGIGDRLDFFAQTLRNSIESDFQGFEDGGLVGSDEALLAALLATFLTAFLAELFGE